MVHLPETDGYSECAFGLHTITFQRRRHGCSAGFGNVPWGAWLEMFRVGHVGAGLVVNGDAVKGDQHAVHEDGEDGMEDMGDEHDAFGQEEEEREDGDDDVELGGAVNGMSVKRFPIATMAEPGERTRQPTAADSGWAGGWHNHR